MTLGLMPPIGTEVQAFFGSHKYRAIVSKHGKVAPHIRFKLKNGRIVEGRATILPHGSPTGVTYRGYLAQMFDSSFYGAKPKGGA
jgi:hypothetical protein